MASPTRLAIALATCLLAPSVGCDPVPFVAPACTVDEPQAFAAYVDVTTIEVVVTAPFDAVSRGAFSTVQPDALSGGALLTQTEKHYLVLDVRPDDGATEITFRTSAICVLSGEDPSDGAKYPHFVVLVEVPATHAVGDPVKVTLSREQEA